jgi:hypothetical protein
MKTSVKTIIVSMLLLACLIIPSGLVLAANAEAKTINGDQFILGQSFTLAADDTLNGNLIVIGGTVTTYAGSIINGDLVLVGGTVSIGGKLTGDIVCVGGTGTVDDTAVVEGDVISAGGWLNISPNAKISGTTNINTPGDFQWNFGELFKNRENFGWTKNPVNRVLTDMFQVLALAALAALVVLIFGKPATRVADAIASSPALSWGVGLLTLLVFPVLMVVMVITLILIPAIPLVILLLILGFVFGYIAIGYEVGRRLENASKGQWAEPISAGIGMLVLGLVTTAIGWIPCLGFVINSAITLFGLGAIVLTLFGTRHYPETPKTPPAMIPPAPPAPVLPLVSSQPQLEEKFVAVQPVKPKKAVTAAPATVKKPVAVTKAAPKKSVSTTKSALVMVKTPAAVKKTTPVSTKKTTPVKSTTKK